MKSEPLSKVAPARSSDRHISADSVVWHLNLDQIVSGSGAIDNRVHAPLRDAGASTFVFDERNVLYSKLRPYLNKVVCPDSIGVATTELVPLRPEPQKLDRNYLCYYLRSPAFVSWVSSQVAGAKMPRVSMKSFWAHEIPLPPLEDQTRIAHLLSKVEGLIAQRKQHLQQLDDLLKSVFYHMFGDPVRNERGWETRPLNELAFVQRGKFTPRPRNDPKYYNGPYPFIQTGDIARSKGRLREFSQTLNDEGTKVSRKFEVGTIVIAIVGATIGETAILELATYATDSVIGLTIKEQGFSSEPVFLEYVMRQWKPTLRANAPEAARANINIETLNPIPIICPPVPLKIKFCKIAIQIESLSIEYQNSVCDLTRVYDVLSQQAFKGELDLTRMILPDGPNSLDLGDTPDPMAEPTDQEDQEPFELPTPSVPIHEDAYQARALAFTEWLNAYTIHLRSRPFSADDFLNLVQQKLSSMEENLDAEWVSEPVGAKDYEQVKTWVFENLHSRQLQQTYDNEKNRVRVSQGKD